MPFYFLAVKPWLQDMKKVACIEIAGNRTNGLQDLSDVKSVNDLMHKKAMPIRNITIKYAKDMRDGSIQGGTVRSQKEKLLNGNETLGETLARLKKEKKTAAKAARYGGSRRASLRIPPKITTENTRRASAPELLLPRDFHSVSSSEEDLYHPEIFHVPDNAADALVNEEGGADLSDISHVEETTSITEEDLEEEDDHTEFSEDDHTECTEHEDEGEEDTLTSALEQPAEIEFQPEDIEFQPQQSHLEVSVQNKDQLRHSHNSDATADLTDDSSSGADAYPIELIQPHPEHPCLETAMTTSLKTAMKIKTLQESLQSAAPLHARHSSDSAPAPPARQASVSAFSVHSTEQEPDKEEHLIQVLGRTFKRQTLQWGTIETREYEICLGDNPACAQGAPIQLDWTYQTQQCTSLDNYEYCRRVQQQRHPRAGCKRLSSRVRHQILLDLGYSPQQMRLASQIKARDQKRRIKTVARLKYMEFDSKVEKIVRIFPQ